MTAATQQNVRAGSEPLSTRAAAQKILIVEDEDIVAADIAETLELSGYRIAGRAASGEDGVRLARQTHPDLVLMDIRLQGELDGISAAALIRESLEIPVVYLTAYADDSTLERAKVTEPYGYVLKPFKELELKTAIEMALHKHQREHPREINGAATPGHSEDDAGQELSEREIEALSFLRRIEPFSGLDDASLRSIARASKIETVRANNLIAFEGDEEPRGFVVISGRVALLKSSPSGKELIVDLLPPGDPFALFAVIDSQRYSVSVKAQVRSTILWLPRAKVLMALDSRPEISRGLLSGVFERLRKAHDFSRALAHDLVEVRVASALCALVPRFCLVEQNQNGDIYSIEMTRQELAEMIGSTSETVIRATKVMEREGLLDLTRSGKIRILDPEGLARIASG